MKFETLDLLSLCCAVVVTCNPHFLILFLSFHSLIPPLIRMPLPQNPHTHLSSFFLNPSIILQLIPSSSTTSHRRHSLTAFAPPVLPPFATQALSLPHQSPRSHHPRCHSLTTFATQALPHRVRAAAAPSPRSRHLRQQRHQKYEIEAAITCGCEFCRFGGSIL